MNSLREIQLHKNEWMRNAINAYIEEQKKTLENLEYDMSEYSIDDTNSEIKITSKNGKELVFEENFIEDWASGKFIGI